jgi:hypothetical protein
MHPVGHRYLAISHQIAHHISFIYSRVGFNLYFHQGGSTMFQKLFERPHAIKKQLTGTLLEERLQFLAHCNEHGAARSTLREIAIYQLIVIDRLNLVDVGIITRTEIEAAAECWAQRQTVSPA